LIIEHFNRNANYVTGAAEHCSADTALSHEVLSLSNALFACRWFASVAPDNTSQLEMVVKGIQSVFTENQNRAR